MQSRDKGVRQQYDKVRTLWTVLFQTTSFINIISGITVSCLATCMSWYVLCSICISHHKESGITDCGKPRNLVRPQDLYNINGNIIYKGNLRDYKILDDVWKKNGNNLHVS